MLLALQDEVSRERDAAVKVLGPSEKVDPVTCKCFSLCFTLLSSKLRMLQENKIFQEKAAHFHSPPICRDQQLPHGS